jgi:hypothetical protein
MTCSHPTRYHETSQGVTVCLLCEIERLQADNKRLADFAAGRGMASEAGGPEEIAVLVCGLHDKVERLERERDALRGELARAIATTPDGYDWDVLHRAHEAERLRSIIGACGFTLYDNGDGRTGLRGHGMIYLPEREAVSDEEAIADIITIAANLQQMRELLDKQEGK